MNGKRNTQMKVEGKRMKMTGFQFILDYVNKADDYFFSKKRAAAIKRVRLFYSF